MKTSEINKEANKIINDLFKYVINTDDKAKWLNMIDFIDKQIIMLENGERGDKMFIFRKVKKNINTLYGKKFVKKC